MLTEKAMERLRAIARGEQPAEGDDEGPAEPNEDAPEAAEDPNDESESASEA